MASTSLRCQSWRKAETEAPVGTRELVVMNQNSPWGSGSVLTTPELKLTLRMLPEVGATVTMPFHDDSMREIPFPLRATFENMPPECYKSGLRHALDFAFI